VNHGRWTPDRLSDVLNTVFWPTMLFVGLRIRRARLGHPSRVGSQREEALAYQTG
jgi:hypothetical protein